MLSSLKLSKAHSFGALKLIEYVATDFSFIKSYSYKYPHQCKYKC